jgi:hypothetical protein
MDLNRALCAQYVAEGHVNYWLSPQREDQMQAILLCVQCPEMRECTIRMRELDPRPSCGVWATRVIGEYLE